MWLGGFVIGYNPDPDGLYGPIARFNFSHYVNDEHTKLISEIASEASFDPAKRVELFKQWQKIRIRKSIPSSTFQHLLINSSKQTCETRRYCSR